MKNKGRNSNFYFDINKTNYMTKFKKSNIK